VRQETDRDGTVQADIAHDDVLLGVEVAVLRGVHDDNATRQPLRHIVVGIALQLQGDARAQPGAQALPGVPSQLHVDGVVGQPGAAKALCHLRRASPAQQHHSSTHDQPPYHMYNPQRSISTDNWPEKDYLPSS
jgi:hypothetical protein